MTSCLLGAFHIGIKLDFQAMIKSAASTASLRSEIRESRSEKNLCTLLRSKPQNDPINISHASKRPPDAWSRTLEKNQKIDEKAKLSSRDQVGC